jgi:nicotinate-nucleotide--dimethylbenzimidazole phosphoribosyltransferase
MNETQAAPLDEIRMLMDALPTWPDAAETGEAEDGLGLLDGLAAWAAAGQGRNSVSLDRPRAALFLGNWEPDRDAGGDGAAQAALEDVRAGRSRLNALCRHHDAELRVYEMAVDDGAGSDTGGGLSAQECATAMAYGMTVVEDGLDLLCLAAAGPGRERAAEALARALSDGNGDPLAALARHGGHALAALAGAVIAARMARVPVILDGFAALAAAAVPARLARGALDHCALAQQLDGPAPRRLQDALGKAAVLDLAIAAEDGSAALLVLGLLRSALAGRTSD